MKMGEKALVELGYQVVPFKIKEEHWRKCRHFFIGLCANGPINEILSELMDSGESVLPVLK